MIGVSGVKVHSVGLTGGAIEVSLSISNPNPYPLPVKLATYRFVLTDSTEVGRGRIRRPVHAARPRLHDGATARRRLVAGSARRGA